MAATPGPRAAQPEEPSLKHKVLGSGDAAQEQPAWPAWDSVQRYAQHTAKKGFASSHALQQAPAGARRRVQECLDRFVSSPKTQDDARAIYINAQARPLAHVAPLLAVAHQPIAGVCQSRGRETSEHRPCLLQQPTASSSAVCKKRLGSLCAADALPAGRSSSQRWRTPSRASCAWA